MELIKRMYFERSLRQGGSGVCTSLLFVAHYCLAVSFRACLSLRSSRWCRESVRSSCRAGWSPHQREGRRNESTARWSASWIFIMAFLSSCPAFKGLELILLLMFPLENACQEPSQNTDEMFRCTAVTGWHSRHHSKDPMSIVTFVTVIAPNEPSQQLWGWGWQGRADRR